MKPIRVAIYIETPISVGGGYQQSLNAALIAKSIQDETIELIFFTTTEDNIHALSRYGIEAKYIIHTIFEQELHDERIDLVYFVSPCGLANTLEKINYIATVWDLCHRDQPAFPEVRWNREFEQRDNYYRHALPRAVATIVDSPAGKQNAICRYGLDSSKVHVIPFEPAKAMRDYTSHLEHTHTNIREKYNLKVPYVYYPAQFWSHKNHVYLLDGLKALEKEYGIHLGAIFSGNDMGNLKHVLDYTHELKLENRVRFIGFVDNEEIPQIYSQSVALVMPTYFGPTNLPPLEAFALGIPVLYPDIDGLRDQVGEAGLLMDLMDPGSMARHIMSLVNSPELTDRLIEAGYERLKQFDAVDRKAILCKIIREFQRKRMCWG